MLRRSDSVPLFVLCCLLVAATAPAAVATGPSAQAARDGRTEPAGVASADWAAAEATDAAQASPELVEAAREGARRGIADAEAAGIAVTPARRTAALRGAELGATLTGSGLTLGIDGTAERTAIPPEQVRVAARGAAVGALSVTRGAGVTPETVLPSVAGGIGGAVLAASIVPTQGGRVTTGQIRAAAHGGAQGTALAATDIRSEGALRVGSDGLLTAAFGGSGGAVTAAGLLPIYGGEAPLVRTYAGALGGASGAVLGTHRRAAGPIPVDANQTAAAALGASGGAVSAVLRDPDLTPAALFAAGRESAAGALGDESLVTTDQISEAALVGAVERLVDRDRAPDALFPVPLSISALPFAVGPPGDPDADGRYEDVNGNGVLTYADVVALSIVVDARKDERVALSREQAAALDFNGDGVLDSRDVRALNVEITGGP